MQLNLSLTPALSHPMGEGESFAVFLEGRASDLAERALAKPKTAIAVPSPSGWERVRVRIPRKKISRLEPLNRWLDPSESQGGFSAAFPAPDRRSALRFMEGASFNQIFRVE